MRISLTATIVLLLAGCASMDRMYSSCEQQHQRFADVSECAKQKITSDSRYGFHNGYIAYANRSISTLNMLEEKVESGAMTEREARYQMSELMAAMRAETAARVNAINASTQANTPVRTTCRINQYTNTANCVSR